MAGHRGESAGPQESCSRHAGPCVGGALALCPAQAWGSLSPTFGRKDLKDHQSLTPRIAHLICHVQASQFLGFTFLGPQRAAV